MLSSVGWISHPSDPGRKCVLLAGSFKEDESYLSLALYAVEYNYDPNQPVESRFSGFRVVASNTSEYVNVLDTWDGLDNVSFSGESENDSLLPYLRFKVVTFKQLKYYTFSKKDLTLYRDESSLDPFVKYSALLLDLKLQRNNQRTFPRPILRSNFDREAVATF